MLGNIITSLDKNNNITFNTKNILSIMDILINKLTFDNKNILKTFNKWHKKEQNDLSDYLTNKTLIPYYLIDIGYFARNDKEIKYLIKLFFNEQNLEISPSNFLYNDVLISCCIINRFKMGITEDQIIYFYNLNMNKISDELNQAMLVLMSSKSYEEAYNNLIHFDYYIKGICLSIAEIKFKYINNLIYKYIYKKINGKKDFYNLFDNYLEERDLNFVNIEIVNPNTKFLVIKSKDNKNELLHCSSLQGLANYIIYQDMEIFNGNFLDDLLTDIKNERDYESFIKEVLTLYPNKNYKDDILKQLLPLIPIFLNEEDPNEFTKILNEINKLNDNYQYELYSNPEDTLKYLLECDENLDIYNKILKDDFI